MHHSPTRRKRPNSGRKQEAFLHRRRLVAIDFDETIADIATNATIRALLPAAQSLPNASEGTAYIAEVLRRVHECGITPTQILESVRYAPEVPGMVRLLKRLRNCYNCDIVIISNANNVFIESWLAEHDLATEHFEAILTNKAHFDKNGMLHIRPHQRGHCCPMCVPNMCKGTALQQFVAQQQRCHCVQYERIIYIGNTMADLCPIVQLHGGDLACVRRGLGLEQEMHKRPGRIQFCAELLIWYDGYDLMRQLELALAHC